MKEEKGGGRSVMRLLTKLKIQNFPVLDALLKIKPLEGKTPRRLPCLLVKRFRSEAKQTVREAGGRKVPLARRGILDSRTLVTYPMKGL